MSAVPPPRLDALTQATKLLASSDKTRAQLIAALLRRGHEAAEAQAAADRARELGYLDDRRVAERRAREDLAEGWCGAALVGRLTAQGLDERTAQAAIDAALEAVGWSAAVAARRLVAARGLEGARGARFLASRGFDEDVITAVLDLRAG